MPKAQASRKTQGDMLANGPAKKVLLLTKHDADPRTVLAVRTLHATDLHQITRNTIVELYEILSKTHAHPHRLIYALTGSIFTHKSPLPFGGSKTSPGYLKFVGPDAKTLLEFIIYQAYQFCDTFRDDRSLKQISTAINRVLAMQYRGMKDMLDELMLRGMKKAGHCNWFGAVYVPSHLSHTSEPGMQKMLGKEIVEFSLPMELPRNVAMLESRKLSISSVKRESLVDDVNNARNGDFAEPEVDENHLQPEECDSMLLGSDHLKNRLRRSARSSRATNE
ncbi:hypothetical protein HDU81_004610 [Chytriomyces hyalinus]|nr:hypothetical protein HDU81_004610 [Chytriomyces hyalinus]